MLTFQVFIMMFGDNNVDISSFHYDVCQFAKHHRVSFPLSNKKLVQPFLLVHTDIWGPSRIPNLSGAR